MGTAAGGKAVNSEREIDAAVDAVLSRPPDVTVRRVAAEPLPAQRRIVDDAIHQARATGLRLPVFAVVFVAGEGGRATDFGDGRYQIELGVDVPPERLRETCYHELQHLADYASGESRGLTRVILERRAVAFATRMFGGGLGVNDASAVDRQDAHDVPPSAAAVIAAMAGYGGGTARQPSAAGAEDDVVGDAREPSRVFDTTRRQSAAVMQPSAERSRAIQLVARARMTVIANLDRHPLLQHLDGPTCETLKRFISLEFDRLGRSLY